MLEPMVESMLALLEARQELLDFTIFPFLFLEFKRLYLLKSHLCHDSPSLPVRGLSLGIGGSLRRSILQRFWLCAQVLLRRYDRVRRRLHGRGRAELLFPSRHKAGHGLGMVG